MSIRIFALVAHLVLTEQYNYITDFTSTAPQLRGV